MTNKEFMKEKVFVVACEKAEVKPMARQASKFRNKKGSAYRFMPLSKINLTMPAKV